MVKHKLEMPANACTCSLMVLEYLCKRMRADEVEQYEALTGKVFDPDAAAVELFRSGQIRYALHDGKGTPIIAGGYDPLIPGVWQSWMVGTEDGWAKHWRDIHRATSWMIQQMMDNGARRLQTMALAKRTAACAWYEKLGMRFAGIDAEFATTGEDVARFEITSKMWEARRDGQRI
jgi:hypothetical protein